RDKKFYSAEEVIIAHDQGAIELHDKIEVRVNKLVNGEIVHELTKTTTGRVLFNEIIPYEIGYKNQTFGKKELRSLINEVFTTCVAVAAAKCLDEMKELVFITATRGGLSFSLEDIVIPQEKMELNNKAQDEVKLIQERYENGFITDNERYNQVI